MGSSERKGERGGNEEEGEKVQAEGRHTWKSASKAQRWRSLLCSGLSTLGGRLQICDLKLQVFFTCS